MSQPTRPQALASVMAIAPYVPGKSGTAGVATLHKLSSNESPMGASPKAVAAFHAAGTALELYPDGNSTALRAAIGRAFGLAPERIVCGNSSGELLSLLAQAYAGPGDEVIYSEYGFLLYPIATMAVGATPVKVKEKDLCTDVDAILAAVTERTKIVYIANPNNPTGTYLPFNEVKRLAAGLPKHVLLVLDAAYCEYVRRNDYESGLELVATSDNVVMTRTFSKIHGLAGLRVGWMVAPDHVCDAVNRIRGPFNVSTPGIAAATAAIEDRDHVARAVDHNEEWVEKLTGGLTALGLTVTPSVGNFILVHFPGTPGRTAADADAFLSANGIIVRSVASYGLPQALRVSIGSAEACEAVIRVLSAFMRATA